MNKRRHVFGPIALLLMVTCVIGGVLLRMSQPPPEEPAAQEPVARVEAASRGMQTVERAALLEAERRLTQMPPPPAPPARVGKFTAGEVEQTEQVFRRMIAFRGLVTQEKERRALSAKLLAMPNGPELLREVLIDTDFAKKAFGEFQAEARYYSIVALEEAAREDKMDLVTSTSAELASQLATRGSPIDPGRAEDLIEVVSVIARHAGSQAFANPTSPVLAKMNFSRRLPDEVADLYARGIFDGIWKAEGIQKAQEITKHLQAM